MLPALSQLRQLAGADNFSAEFNTRLDGLKKDGTTMKVISDAGRTRYFLVQGRYAQVARVAAGWECCAGLIMVGPIPRSVLGPPCRSTWR